MATGRRRATRIAAIGQAQIVWYFLEEGEKDLSEFIRCGQLPGVVKARMDPELEANVEKEMARIAANGGKLIVG